MTKVEKVFNMWSDLEATYAKLGKGKSRSEFMKALTGYTSLGNHSINYILTQLTEDVKKTDSADIMDKYSLVVETLKLLSNHLDCYGIPLEIDNLNAFLLEAVGGSKDLLTEEDLHQMYRRQEYSAYELPYKDMITKFKCVYNYVEYAKDRFDKKKMVPYHYIGIENVTDKFKLFKIENVYDYIMSNSKSTDSFVISCLKVLSVLIQTKSIESVVCISSPDNIEDSKIFGVEMEFVEQINFNNLCIIKFRLGDTPIYVLC